MNIEIANRLLEYRKKSGLSQEELADKLNISRQSVSKWERAESSPDTDNLIELAKIYNVTLDELLNGSNETKTQTTSTMEVEVGTKVIEKPFFKMTVHSGKEYDDVEDNNLVLFKDKVVFKYKDQKEGMDISWNDVYMKDENGNDMPLDKTQFKKKYLTSQQKTFLSIAASLVSLIAVALYLSLCATKIMEYSKFWVVFIGIPVVTSIIECIVHRSIKEFNFVMLVTLIYLSLGVYVEGTWGIFWFLFLLIPVYYTFIKIFDKKIAVYVKDDLGNEHCFELDSDDVAIKQ